MDKRTELEDLVSEPVALAINRERTELDKLSSPFAGSFVLFGAGNLGRKTLHGLRAENIEPLAFADNNSALAGTTVDGLSVLSPWQAAARFSDRAAFVVTIWRAGGGHRFESTREQLSTLGCFRVLSFVPLYWRYAPLFLPYYAIELPHKLLNQSREICEAFDLWADDQSRNEYVSQIRWRLKSDFGALSSPVLQPQHLPDDLFTLADEEVFVDCGAYDGDSIRAFLGQHPAFKGRIVAVEPDQTNFERLTRYLMSLPNNVREKITAEPVAVGARREAVQFQATGDTSAGIGVNGGCVVEAFPLDGFLDGVTPTFIKMDIEGAELDALLGAQHIICNALPILAVSVYHKPDDLWHIPLLLRSFSDKYRFFLRPQDEEGWDLICYAVPVDRLKCNRTMGQ